MQIIKRLRLAALLLVPIVALSQSSTIPFGDKAYDLISRLEIKTGDSNLMFSTIKPLNRRIYTREVNAIDSLAAAGAYKNLTETDRYNIQRFLMNNNEWATWRRSFESKQPVAGFFYQTPAHFFEVHQKDFFLAADPMINYEQMFEKGNSQNLFINRRGFNVRGLVGKVGFDVFITDNQERDPMYVQQWIDTFKTVPGVRFYKQFKAKGGVDYFNAGGSISFAASKYIDLQLGYDRNFIGDGFRSLLLSDFSPNGLFFKINTRIWKFQYQNLYMELIPGMEERLGGDEVVPRKYFRMNSLSINATKWLNVGLFDAVIFGRKDHFDFQYLIPVIFLRPAESDIGSGDNAIVGVNLKANIKHKVQVYGQVVLDEFLLKQLFKKTGYWANKYGYQIGVKYPDAFGIKNLDLQVENNRLRPFTFSHFDSVSDYSHSNQPLAHPLGAGFQEDILIVKYQPLHKLFITAKAIFFKQGLDSLGRNMGSNILRSYKTRPRNYDFFIGSGDEVKAFNASLLVSYELKENLFIDAGVMHRTYNRMIEGDASTTVVSFGVRLNMARRTFDF